jgi:hypothetical protein
MIIVLYYENPCCQASVHLEIDTMHEGLKKRVASSKLLSETNHYKGGTYDEGNNPQKTVYHGADIVSSFRAEQGEVEIGV